MRNLYLFVFLSVILQSASAQTILNLKYPSARFWTSLESAQSKFILQGLQAGQQYELVLNSPDCPVSFDSDSTNNFFTFTATSKVKEILLFKTCTENTSFWISASIVSIKNSKLDKQTESNLTVANNLSASELVQGVLIGNNCSLDLNVQQHGSSQQFGTFSNGMDAIGFESGIIITSGSINNAPGPNNSGSLGSNVPGNYSDPDLSYIATKSTYDAAVIEFDFTPVTDQIQFEYVFASEEYCEFVNDDYNDVFGFFISGPGINGTLNIARVPGTGEVVSIDNINHLKNTSFFYPNSSSCQGETNMADIQFDGFTHPLVASATVIPCETYHIKLAIADVGDGIYDSAVFLKAGSFSAGDIVNIVPKSTILQAQTAYEGCKNGYLLFDRSCSNNIDLPLTLTINVLSSSTALEGIDYEKLPQTFTIPAGISLDSFPIFAHLDGLSEGDEQIDIEVIGQYPCYKPTVSIVISDPVPIVVTSEDQTLCSQTDATFSPLPQGGLLPYTYEWQDGSTNSTFTKNYDATETITCTVTDICNNSSEAIFNITAIPLPEGEISGDGILCDQNSSSHINLDFTGPSPWDVVIEKDGVEFFSKQYASSASNFDVIQPGQYRIKSISSYGCVGVSKGEVDIKASTLTSAYEKIDVSCTGFSDGSIVAKPINGRSPYQYQWNNIAETNSINQLVAGTYSYTITDSDDCKSTQTIEVEEPEALILTIDELEHTNCYFPQGGTISTQVTGGSLPYSYSWNQGASSSNLSNLVAGEYHGKVVDNHGCIDSIVATIVGDLAAPITMLHPPSDINCYQPTVEISSQGSSIGSDYTYNWTTQVGNIVSNLSALQATVDASGLYLLELINTKNGCRSKDSVEVHANLTPPTIAVGSATELNCTDTSVVIGTADTLQGFDYVWTSSLGNFIASNTTPQTIVNEAGLYELTVINTLNGCTAKDAIQVSAITTYPSSAELVIKQPSCLGNDGQITITQVQGGSPPLMYSFDGGQSFYSEPILPLIGAGTYPIVIQDIYGCEYAEQTQLSEPNPPSLNVTEEYFIEMGEQIKLVVWASQTASALASILWTPMPDNSCVHCLTPIAAPLETTHYTLKIIDSLHCEATANMVVIVQDPSVYIPNVFAPGSSFGNNRFTVYGDQNKVAKVNQLLIYDRWGSQVFINEDFHVADPRAGWDGLYRGKNVAAGVYVYFAKIELINGKQLEYRGDLTLIR